MKMNKRWLSILIVSFLIIQNIILPHLIASNGVYADAGVSDISADLTWDAVAGADKYRIYKDDVFIGETTVNNYSDTDIKEDKIYVYLIKAYSFDKELDVTVPLKVSTVLEHKIPPVPMDVTGSAISPTGASISWMGTLCNNTSNNIHMQWVHNYPNLAFKKSYSKSVQPDSQYIDSNNTESTDGTLANDFPDGKSYGYRVPDNGISVDIIIDLDAVQSINDVKVHKWLGSNFYDADVITISTSQDGINYLPIESSDNVNEVWHNFSFPTVNARYIKVNFNKSKCDSKPSDWLFIDEIQVFNKLESSVEASNENLAFHKTYTMSEPPDNLYKDLNSDSTDGILAKDYVDQKSYGYRVAYGDTKSVDVTLDLGSITNLNEVKVHRWEGSNYYEPDTINVYGSKDGVDYEWLGSPKIADSVWFDLAFYNKNSRYVKVKFIKKNDAPGHDWLFIDEIQIYNNAIVSDYTANTYEIEEDGNIIENGTNTTYTNNNLKLNMQHIYRVREKNGPVVSAWSTPVTIFLQNTEVTATPVPTITPEPTAVPTVTPEPTALPTVTPEPIAVPTVTPEPTAVPTIKPEPTKAVVPEPTAVPAVTPEPTKAVVPEPTAVPAVTPEPTKAVVPEPTAVPAVTPEPTKAVVPEPTAVPEISPEPTKAVVPEPTAVPAVSPEPTKAVVPEPTAVPEITPEPTKAIAPEPTAVPAVTPEPTKAIAPEPTAVPAITPEPTKAVVPYPPPLQEITPEPTKAVVPEPTTVPEVNPESTKAAITPKPTAEIKPEPTKAAETPKPTAEVKPEPTKATVTPKPTAEVKPEPTKAVVTPIPTVEVKPEPLKAAIPKPTVEVISEPTKVVVQEPPTEVAPEPTKAVLSDQVVEIIPEPTKAVVLEPTTDVIPEPTKAAIQKPSAEETPEETEAPEPTKAAIPEHSLNAGQKSSSDEIISPVHKTHNKHNNTKEEMLPNYKELEPYEKMTAKKSSTVTLNIIILIMVLLGIWFSYKFYKKFLNKNRVCI